MGIEDRLHELGIEIPPHRAPAGNYVPAVVIGNLVYSSGQVSARVTGEAFHGQLGLDLDVASGYRAARLCALNCLAAIRSVTGTLDVVAGIVQVRGYVRAVGDFGEHPAVMNGASDLLVEVFGESGRHVRTAIGVASLPKGCAVEVEVVARLLS